MIKRKKTMEAVTISEECPRYNICDANLCPYDPELRYRVWYPNESVCAKQDMVEKFPWIKTQRKVVRRSKEPDKYFVLEMLTNLSQVRKATVGLSPDVNYKIQINSWLKDHHKAKKRRYTEEEKQAFREKMIKLRELKNIDLRGQATLNF